jgi:hypothetical protein
MKAWSRIWTKLTNNVSSLPKGINIYTHKVCLNLKHLHRTNSTPTWRGALHTQPCTHAMYVCMCACIDTNMERGILSLVHTLLANFGGNWPEHVYMCMYTYACIHIHMHVTVYMYTYTLDDIHKQRDALPMPRPHTEQTSVHAYIQIVEIQTVYMYTCTCIHIHVYTI